jgi:type VI secretion system protein ImpE
MNASELFKAGRLDEAVDAQLAEVKAKPADGARRLFLFELLVFAGDIERAAKQGNLVKFGEIEIDSAMQGYVKLLDAEHSRRRVFREGTRPQTFGPPSDSLAPRFEALDLMRASRQRDAAELLARSLPTTLTGELNGKTFTGLLDCDDLLTNVLEVVTVQGYFWVPLADVRSLTTLPPKTPRDLFWLPGQLELDDQSGPVFLPALYPFSHEHANDAVKLGRLTEWLGGQGELVRGAGQKTYLAGEDAVGLLDIRELSVNATMV